MRLLKITAPIAALVLLTGACGPAKKAAHEHTPYPPLPSISPAAGPALKRVWQAPLNSVALSAPESELLSAPESVGNVVLAQERQHFLLFIDGTTGRVTARAALGVLDTDIVRAVTDGAGRPLVSVTPGPGKKRPKERVYDTNGRLVWKAHSGYETFAGGYSIAPEKGRAVVRTSTGRTVADLPLSRSYQRDFEGGTAPGIALQAVRPGLLVASGFGPGESEVALLDVSRPGRARVTLLRMPFKPSVHHPVDAQVAVSGKRLYVSWKDGFNTHREPVARYDIPGTRPVWHRLPPEGVDPAPIGSPPIRAFPAANGGADAVVIGNGERPKYWLLDPATGKATGPRDGRDGKLEFVSGGRAYVEADDSDGTSTDAVDLRTGAVRTIDTRFAGATLNGDLIDLYGSAYRWN